MYVSNIRLCTHGLVTPSNAKAPQIYANIRMHTRTRYYRSTYIHAQRNMYTRVYTHSNMHMHEKAHTCAHMHTHTNITRMHSRAHTKTSSNYTCTLQRLTLTCTCIPTRAHTLTHMSWPARAHTHTYEKENDIAKLNWEHICTYQLQPIHEISSISFCGRSFVHWVVQVVSDVSTENEAEVTTVFSGREKRQLSEIIYTISSGARLLIGRYSAARFGQTILRHSSLEDHRDSIDIP